MDTENALKINPLENENVKLGNVESQIETDFLPR